jgi:hypothetical protein
MEFEKFRDGILQLAAEIRDMSHIISFMREFYINIPITIVEATPPFLARCRPNFDGQIFERKSEISYNPKVSEIRLQRANFDSQQVFYGALPTESDCDFGNCQNTALLETVMEHVKDHRIHRQLLTLSRWKVSIRPATSLPGFIGHIALFNKTNAYGISKAGKDVHAR